MALALAKSFALISIEMCLMKISRSSKSSNNYIQFFPFLNRAPEHGQDCPVLRFPANSKWVLWTYSWRTMHETSTNTKPFDGYFQCQARGNTPPKEPHCRTGKSKLSRRLKAETHCSLSAWWKRCSSSNFILNPYKGYTRLWKPALTNQYFWFEHRPFLDMLASGFVQFCSDSLLELFLKDTLVLMWRRVKLLGWESFGLRDLEGVGEELVAIDQIKEQLFQTI